MFNGLLLPRPLPTFISIVRGSRINISQKVRPQSKVLNSSFRLNILEVLPKFLPPQFNLRTVVCSAWNSSRVASAAIVIHPLLLRGQRKITEMMKNKIKLRKNIKIIANREKKSQ